MSKSQVALFDEIEQLLTVLQDRSNRDKLNDREFLLAGSLLERWKWNASAISDDDLRDFLASARDLVSQIEAVDSLVTRKQIAAPLNPKQTGSRTSSQGSRPHSKRVSNS